MVYFIGQRVDYLMSNVNISQLSDEELMLLLNEQDSESLVNETMNVSADGSAKDGALIGSNVSLEQMSDDNLLDYLKISQGNDNIMEQRASGMKEYLWNNAKMGFADPLTTGKAFLDSVTTPFQHVFGHLFFGSGGFDQYQKNQESMMSEFRNYKNSDEYEQLLARAKSGDVKAINDIESTIKAIQVKGGSPGWYWQEMVDAITWPDIPFTEKATYFETFMNNVLDEQEYMADFNNTNPHLRSPDGKLWQEATGMGVRFMSDPSFRIGSGVTLAAKSADSSALQSLQLIQRSNNFFKNSANTFVIGVASMFGGEAGGQVEQKITDDEETGIGRLFGSIIGGGVAVFNPITVSSKFVAAKTKDLWKKRTWNKANPDIVAEQYVTGGVKKIYELMEGELTPEKFQALVTEFKKVGHTLDAGNIPLMIMAADSPTMQGQLKRLMQSDPLFRKKVEEEVYKLGLLIDERADAIFGTRYSPVNLEELPAQLRNQGERLIALRMELDRKIEALDLSFVPGKADEIGNQIRQIVEKREAIARKEMKPIYQAIDDEAAAANIMLPPEATTALYDFVTANNLRDLFGKRTPIDNKIQAFLKPQMNTEKVLVDQVRADGTTIQVERMRGELNPDHKMYIPPESKPLTWAQMDSLKRAINAFSRENLNSTERRKLAQFKTYFNEQRLSLVALEKETGLAFDNTKAMELNARLDAADVLYYEKIGIPYSAEGIVQINSKKYATEIYPVLFKNSESLNHFLSVSGKEGKEVAQNAYILNMYDKVMKDGVFNPKKVQILMRKDRRLLDQLPEVRTMLEKSLVDQGELMLRRDAINNASKDFEMEIANHFLISSALSPNYPALATRLYKGDMAFYQKIQKDLEKLDTSSARIVNDNIKREYVTQVFNSKDGGMKYILDPTNSKMVNAIFEPEQVTALRNLSTLSDQLKKIDIVELNNKATAQIVDPVAKHVPGVTTQYGAAQIRDRVSSIGMKVIRILTHINEAKLASKLDRGIQQLILHKDIEKLNVWGKTNDWKLSAGSFNALKNIIGEMIPTYIHGSTEGFFLQELQEESNQRVREGNI